MFTAPRLLFTFVDMKEAQAELSEVLGLPEAGGQTEAEFLRRLADAVDYWMQHRMEQLMSICYTLDVDERLVAEAFHPGAPEPANVGLARLLYERQRARIRTKQEITSPPLNEDDDAW